jgi:hypothetical protein
VADHDDAQQNTDGLNSNHLMCDAGFIDEKRRFAASLMATTNYRRACFYGSAADMRAIAARLPGSRVVRRGIFYCVVDADGTLFGPGAAQAPR